MTTLSNSRSSSSLQGRSVPGWMRSISLRVAGIMVLVLALLFTIVSYTLHMMLNYPDILPDKASFAISLLARGEIAALLGFTGLLLCGILLFIISLALVPHLEEKRRRSLIITGGASGVCWAVGALLGLALLPLWGSAQANAAHVAATIMLVFAELAAPLLLALWTVTLARQFRAYRVLGWVGAIGLLLAFARSLVWVLNALLPVESGFYATAGILNVLALLGESFWLFWLLLFGFRLLAQRTIGATQLPQTRETHADQERMKRRRFLQVMTSLGIGLVGTVFVGARTGLTIASPPDVEGDDIPSEPSSIATLYFLLMWILFKFIYPIHTVAQLLSTSYSSTLPPPDVTIEQVDAGGVPAQRMLVPGAVNSRWILHFHPGGFTRAGLNDNRAIVVRFAKATGASVLYPDYRGTPDHPFPAGLNGCVTAYRWLRRQGVAASQIVITGESAGANLVLATALSLRESGEALPGALIAVSPPTDLAMTGETLKTKAVVDPLIAGGLAQDAFALYTNHGATDPRNPLVSPLYADVQGLPPTLLLVGSEEALLSDSMRMADRLKAAGVEVKLEIWPGMWHDFVGSPDSIPEVRLATQHIAKFMRQHLGT